MRGEASDQPDRPSASGSSAVEANDLEARLARLPSEKRSLLERRLSARRAAAPVAPEITRRETNGPAPLSYMQELLWLVQELDPEAYVYNSPMVRLIRGPLDVNALQRAIDAVVERHEILRTTYSVIAGRPMQVVQPLHESCVRIVDLSNLSDRRDDAIQQLVLQEWRRPFDLANDIMVRATIARLGDEDHLFLMIGHHISWDGWSKGVVYRELNALYPAFAAGQDPQLPQPTIQYADFAEWQRRWLGAGAFNHQLEYWRGKLGGAAPLLELPTDRPRPAVQTHHGARDSLWMSTELGDRLESLSGELHGTLFMTLLAAVYVLLHRYSGQDDIVIGTPIAGRNRTELENLVGYFTNALPLRTDCSGDPTFRELFERVRETAVQAYEKQDAPFERLVQELQPERDPSHTPLFQVMFALQNFRPRTSGGLLPPTTLDLPGLSAEAIPIPDPGYAKFDLMIGMGVRPEGLHASFEFKTDLFDKTTIDRMRGHFQTLLEAIVENPDRRISELPLLTAEERCTLLERWSASGQSEPAPELLHRVVEASAERSPAARAAVFDGQTLTYEELDQRANQLAHHLRRLGVGRDTPVGIFIDRSLELAVALLGTLKAGGACLPLDPDYPSERLAFMLRDAAAPVLLTIGRLEAVSPEHSGRTIRVDRDWASIETEPSSPPATETQATDVAYVVYTSGSTGRPRGVQLTHEGLARHAGSAVSCYGLTADDVVLQFASVSFDISIEELFPTWLAGATVLFREPNVPIFGRELLTWMRKAGVTVLDLPTAYWHEWVNDLVRLGESVPESVRAVIVGGEKAIGDAYRAWLGVGGDRVRWFNTYGPTETSVVASVYEPASSADARPPDEIPIGRPFGPARLFVLDRNGQLVPIGVPGELYIGGAGLARGYVGLPELTSEKFVPDPFSDDSAARVYRTGDLVRWRADGELEYLGRTDDQLKIRGFRVEPGEVEAALLRHPDIANAIVLPLKGQSGDVRLVAYVEARGSALPKGAELRAFAAEILPNHMVPAGVVVMDSFPLTTNGKVDRAALPEPGRADLETAELVLPKDELEGKLVELWQQALGIEDRISTRDDFFALGGHSLLAVRVFGEIATQFGVRLPLALLFQGSTIEHLADAIRRERSASTTWSTIVPLRPEGNRPPLFFLHGIDGEILFYRDLVRNLDPDQPVYAIQPRGLDGRESPHTRVEDMAADYVRELRRFQPVGPYLLGGHCFSGVLAYEVARQLEHEGERAALLAVIDGTPVGHGPRQTRRELERKKLADFLQRDLAGKAEWIRVRGQGVWLKLRRRLLWLLHDVFVRAGRPLPKRLRDVRFATARARSAYMTPESSCRVTFFRAEGEVSSSPQRVVLWEQVAKGGLEVHPIRSEGVRHDNILEEPHASVLAAELDRCIRRALAAEPPSVFEAVELA